MNTMWMSILLADISHEAMNERPEFPWSWKKMDLSLLIQCL
jgi:hypothetical protein